MLTNAKIILGCYKKAAAAHRPFPITIAELPQVEEEPGQQSFARPGCAQQQSRQESVAIQTQRWNKRLKKRCVKTYFQT